MQILLLLRNEKMETNEISKVDNSPSPTRRKKPKLNKNPEKSPVKPKGSGRMPKGSDDPLRQDNPYEILSDLGDDDDDHMEVTPMVASRSGSSSRSQSSQDSSTKSRQSRSRSVRSKDKELLQQNFTHH